MALYRHFTMDFNSIKGKDYQVNIYKEGQPSSVRTLRPATHPFTIDEDDDEDIYKVLRGQTGYLSILTNDRSLISALIPENATSNYVTLHYRSQIVWQGYMQPQAFDFPWRENTEQYFEVKFPLASPLEVLSMVTFPLSMLTGSLNIAKLLYYSCCEHDGLPTSESSGCLFTDYYITNYIGFRGPIITGGPLGVCVNSALLYDEEEIVNEGRTSTLRNAHTCADILEKVLKQFGLILREAGRSIFIDVPDRVKNVYGTTYQYNQYAAALMKNIANDVDDAITDGFDSDSYDLLPNLGISMGDEPKEEWLDTLRRRVKIELDVEDYSELEIEQPTVGRTVDADEKIAYDYFSQEMKVLVAYDAQTTEVFTPNYTAIRIHSDAQSEGHRIESPYTRAYDIGATPQTLISTSLFGGNLTSPQGGEGGEAEDVWHEQLNMSQRLVLGAVLCRFYMGKTGGTGRNDGILLQQQDVRTYTKADDGWIDVGGIGSVLSNPPFQRPWDDQYFVPACTIRGGKAGLFQDGYFCINFSIIAATYDPYDEGIGMCFGNSNNGFKDTLHVLFKVGNQYWSDKNKAWQTDINGDAIIDINTDENGQVETNKSEYMSVEGDKGFFIPIAEEGLEGEIQLIILNYARRWSDGALGSRDCHTRILYGLKIEIKGEINPSGISSDNNTYTASTGVSAQQDEDVSLDFGSCNNNEHISSPSFYRYRSGNTYIELPNPIFEEGQERLEVSLLNRLVAYHSKIRRMYEVRSLIDSPTAYQDTDMRRYIHNGKAYMRIAAHADFADDFVDYKFLEVKGI